MAADNCPKNCNHETFHYCGENGTHCDKHCSCKCPLCTKENKERSKLKWSEENGSLTITKDGTAYTVKIGQKYRHLDGYLYHVRGFVDGQTVARFWAAHKNRWAYELIHPVAFTLLGDGIFKLEK